MQSQVLRRLSAACCLVLAAAGCAALGLHRFTSHSEEFGAVKIWSEGATRHIEDVRQTTSRDPAGRLVVRLTWRNTSDKPCKVRIRKTFFDEDGLAEKDAYQWDIHEVPVGEEFIEWFSRTPQAARYVIEVRSAGGWLF